MNRQAEIDFSKRITEAHIEIARDHADAVIPNWSEDAFTFLKDIFLPHRRSPFMTEDLRESAEGVIPQPPSLRAWGAVILRAARAGLVKRVGMAKVKNAKAHRANANVWQRTQHAVA